MPYTYKAGFRYDKATQHWTALRSSSYLQGISYRMLLTKDGGKPLSLMRFPFLHYPQGFTPSLSEHREPPAQGLISLNAIPGLISHCDPLCWCTESKTPDALCACYLSSISFTTPKNFQASIQNQVAPAWSGLSQHKVLACLQLTFDASLPSPSPAYSYLLSFFPSLLEFEL